MLHFHLFQSNPHHQWVSRYFTDPGVSNSLNLISTSSSNLERLHWMEKPSRFLQARTRNTHPHKVGSYSSTRDGPTTSESTNLRSSPSEWTKKERLWKELEVKQVRCVTHSFKGNFLSDFLFMDTKFLKFDRHLDIDT